MKLLNSPNSEFNYQRSAVTKQLFRQSRNFVHFCRTGCVTGYEWFYLSLGNDPLCVFQYGIPRWLWGRTKTSFDYFPHTPLLVTHSLFSSIPAARKDCLHFTFCFSFGPWQGRFLGFCSFYHPPAFASLEHYGFVMSETWVITVCAGPQWCWDILTFTSLSWMGCWRSKKLPISTPSLPFLSVFLDFYMYKQ